MKNNFFLLAISIVAVAIDGQKIPEFENDEDLSAWHEFGLKHFHGRWSVIQRKPNGDLIKYSDYGLPIPDDFQPINQTSDEFRDSENNENFEDQEKRLEKSILREMIDYSQNEGKDTLELIGIIGIVQSNEETSDKP